MVNQAKEMGKKIVYHAHSTEEDFRNSFIGSNQLSPLVQKYLVDYTVKRITWLRPLLIQSNYWKAMDLLYRFKQFQMESI